MELTFEVARNPRKVQSDDRWTAVLNISITNQSIDTVKISGATGEKYADPLKEKVHSLRGWRMNVA